MEMPAPARSLSERYPAMPPSIPDARRALVTFASDAGVPAPRLDDVRLAVSEALTNAVVHGFEDLPGEIHVTAAVVSSEMWILICDDGDGLRVRTEKSGLGLGLALMAQASDEFTIVPRSRGGTEVRMRFSLRSAQEHTDQADEAGRSDRYHGGRRQLSGAVRCSPTAAFI